MQCRSDSLGEVQVRGLVSSSSFWVRPPVAPVARTIDRIALEPFAIGLSSKLTSFRVTRAMSVQVFNASPLLDDKRIR